MKFAFVVLAGLVLAGCGSAPCEGFCKLDCQNIFTCNGAPLSGSQVDACTSQCTAYVKAHGATSVASCDCGGDAGRTCDNMPETGFSFSC
ncbi:MAG: hypothetical protein JST54_14070 [Deltaproteobacteria bacterium]|nr:hypothetical protein [Deltaproteobacteria bacterium]